jgi:cis-3-alkyl-4-acyloxetan-2-one decarboxylase
VTPVVPSADYRPLYPFTSRYAEVNGRRMHYVDEGRGEPLVMLHGNPTWSFYYRELIRGLAGSHRCIAPDHIGCGLSDRPTDAEYGFRLQDRVADLEAFMSGLELSRPFTLIVHDWGGMIGAAFAVRRPERITRLVVLNTAAFLKPHWKPLPWALRFVRTVPLVSEPAVLRLNLFARGAAWTASARGLSPAVRRGLLAPYRSPQARLATLRFVQDIPLSPGDPSYPLAALVDQGLARLAGKPILICWGERDFVFDLDYLAEWQRRFPQAETHRFPHAGHYVLEDEPHAILARIRDFLARTPPPD